MTDPPQENRFWAALTKTQPAQPVDPVVVPINTNGTTRYGQAALTKETDRLLETPEGQRNHQLNIAAFSLSQLIAAGHLNQTDVETQLAATARQIGLEPTEIHRTIHSGFRAGLQQPRNVPERPEPPATVTALAVSPPTADIDIDEETPRTSWWPEPIGARAATLEQEPAPQFLTRDDGNQLLYAGKVNGFIGESESGKSWLAQQTVTEAINNGQLVLYLDFEDNPKSVKNRVLALGADPEKVDQQLYYASPDEALGIIQRNDLQEALSIKFPLIILDGVNAAMGILGYKINDNDDATAFTVRLLRPLASTGACVLTVDHISKNPDTRGKGGIGAQAKRAMIDGACILVEVAEPFGKGQTGELKLTVDKDRNGHVRGNSAFGKYAGKAEIVSIDNTVRITIQTPPMRVDGDDQTQPDWEPTIVMEKISRLLEGLTAPCSKNAIESTISGGAKIIRKAIDILHRRGHISIQSGPRGGAGMQQHYPVQGARGGQRLRQNV